jgi:uncharacterized protein
MQINKDEQHGKYVIQRYENGKVTINDVVYTRNLILSATVLIENWDPQDFGPILSLKPEVVILGTGSTLVFPDQAALQSFYKHKIGVEVMDSAAACRTFNVLMAEDRNAVVALIV